MPLAIVMASAFVPECDELKQFAAQALQRIHPFGVDTKAVLITDA